MEKKSTSVQRARCPDFQARTDYRGRHYIHCGGKALLFQDNAMRNAWYIFCCCGQYKDCTMYEGGQKHGNTDGG